MRQIGSEPRLHLDHTLLWALGLGFALTANADDGDSMTHTAKVAQSIQVRLEPIAHIPASYNYNQNRQPRQNYTQSEFQLAPMLPIALGEKSAFILNPIFTDNVNS